MGSARHAGSRSGWTIAGIVAIAVILLGGAAFAAVRLTSGNESAAPGPTTAPPATSAPRSVSPTTAASTSAPTTAPTTGPTTAPTTGATSEPTTEPTTGSTTAPATSSPPPPGGPPGRTLRQGMSGPDVLDLQHRLQDLGYWLGHADGSYGDATTQAVLAFQGWEGLPRDGIVGPHTQTELQHAKRPVPKDPSTNEIEIDKFHQVILVVRNGQTKYVFHTSTGTEQPYVDPDGNDQVADTPVGHFTFTWAVDGWRDGDLGPLYRPRYFHPTGVAIHGYGNVPGYRASHGCARVSFEAINFIWAEDLAPLTSKVWVYES